MCSQIAVAFFIIFSTLSGFQVKDKPETCRLGYNESSHNTPTQNAIRATTHRDTVFHHLLKFIPRHRFADLDEDHGTGRKTRKFTRWDQFAAFMFMQIPGRASLR